MSFDLTLMTDSASVPAGKSADDSTMKSRANAYLQQLKWRFSFYQFFHENTWVFIWPLTEKLCSISGKERRGKESQGKKRRRGKVTTSQEKGQEEWKGRADKRGGNGMKGQQRRGKLRQV